ncbi:hypothetical protein AcW2_006141 [Taiwanofungus camphoratus]|nr:hypothetical protein AcW2_006141 [Antrodia cinnamomea]
MIVRLVVRNKKFEAEAVAVASPLSGGSSERKVTATRPKTILNRAEIYSTIKVYLRTVSKVLHFPMHHQHNKFTHQLKSGLNTTSLVSTSDVCYTGQFLLGQLMHIYYSNSQYLHTTCYDKDYR